ncbi:MAG: hypothetical protein Q4A10_06575 [Aerococcaceae bacterium]|nr:hypothetical protein [Aerococcaceae bacterium]
MNKLIEQLINETMGYDFPFMASENKKKEIISEKKLHIETEFRQILADSFPDQEILDRIWNEAVMHADESFSSLSPKLKLNGFYLQELMHCYSEKLGAVYVPNKEEE